MPMEAIRQAGSPVTRTVRLLAPQWPFAAVSALAAVAVAVTALGGLERGLILLGGALLLGSVLRFVLPPSRAGLLAVRRRGTDVVTMALLAIGVLSLALWLVVDGA